jgi:hypothetical protein
MVRNEFDYAIVDLGVFPLGRVGAILQGHRQGRGGSSSSKPTGRNQLGARTHVVFHHIEQNKKGVSLDKERGVYLIKAEEK